MCRRINVRSDAIHLLLLIRLLLLLLLLLLLIPTTRLLFCHAGEGIPDVIALQANHCVEQTICIS